MKKNKGFTLVELLAVIVILAIIALIATPVVLSMIESSRQGSAESSMLAYVQSVENAVLTGMMNSTTAVDFNNEYTVVGLTLTSKAKRCLSATGTEVDGTGSNGACGTDQKANPKYQVFNIDLKGDHPVTATGSTLTVDKNSVKEAKLKFGKYYVSYFYDSASGTATYCSDDSKFAASKDACQA